MNKFLQTCIGLAIVLFATGFLIRSVQPAYASESSPKSTNKIGWDGDSYTGVGISDGYAYYIRWAKNGSQYLEKISLGSASSH